RRPLPFPNQIRPSGSSSEKIEALPSIQKLLQKENKEKGLEPPPLTWEKAELSFGCGRAAAALTSGKKRLFKNR
ncbi:MAG TPA: hypothetical protein VFA47_13275, partial [Candidatus Manganitrophaceae bacterium]|nr:hypothetical protein [Candidatus Manganitrophaceae bacterium]